MSTFGFISTIDSTILVFGFLLVLVLAASEYRPDGTRKRRLLVGSMTTHALSMGFKLVSWLLVRRPGNLVRALLLLCLTASDALAIVTCLCIMVYVYTDVSGNSFEQRMGEKPLVRLLWVLNGVGALLALTNPLTHLYYALGEGNVYVAGRLYWLRDAFYLCQGVLMMPVVLNLASRVGEPMTRRFVACGVLVISTTALELLIPGLVLLPAGVSLVLVLLASGVQSRLEADLAHARAEAAESRVRLLSGQIDRHFVFNSLTAIKELVAEDPTLAERTIQDFSDYLRSHLDVMADTRLVPFEDELERVRHYVALEEADCVNPLEVRYELGTTDFELPPLTVQPLVENAIRHGIRTREGGGAVVVSTVRRPHGVEVRVTDDGHGLSSATALQDERHRVGIANVRERIERQCNGQLTIQSDGSGTLVTLTIPKEWEGHEDPHRG